MKKLLVCLLTSTFVATALQAQDNLNTQESLEKLLSITAQLQDQMGHINTKLNGLQTSSETVTSKLTDVLTQLASHVKNNGNSMPTPAPELTPSPLPTPEPLPTVTPETTPQPELTPAIAETPALEQPSSEQPSEQSADQPQEATLLGAPSETPTEQQQQDQPQEDQQELPTEQITL